MVALVSNIRAKDRSNSNSAEVVEGVFFAGCCLHVEDMEELEFISSVDPRQ